MTKLRLSIEERARILFDNYIRRISELPEDIRNGFDSKDSRLNVLKDYRKDVSKANTLFCKLQKGKYFSKINGIEIYDLIIDSMNGDPNLSRFEMHNSDTFNRSSVINMPSKPNLYHVLIDLSYFYVEPMVFRCTLNDRFDYTLNNGTDRTDKRTFASEYYSKALKYGGSMPKILLAYNSNRLKPIKDYEYEFLDDDPKLSLICAMRINLKK
nr:hypothetical protein [Candidatus Woesearchaeota archaeon]